MVETIFDTLNAKAALFAYTDFFEGRDPLPLIISATLIDLSGRNLSGQTIEAFFASVSHMKPVCMGINCALGPVHMYPFLERLHNICPFYVHAYANAGLPDGMGGFSEDKFTFVKNISKFIDEGFVNMVGGCCGTTPEFIEQLYPAIQNKKPRVPQEPRPYSLYSGLDEFVFRPEVNFVNVGERCNISGSIRFKNMIIKSNDYEKAIEVAREQV
jgi:5-methyltetrahydrofolate--homocysteine methyltransferase